jgi:hypothetical protein
VKRSPAIKKPSSTGTGLGVAIGAGLGIPVAVLLGGPFSLAIGIAIGAGVGVALGSAWDSGRRPGQGKRGAATPGEESPPAWAPLGLLRSSPGMTSWHQAVPRAVGDRRQPWRSTPSRWAGGPVRPAASSSGGCPGGTRHPAWSPYADRTATPSRRPRLARFGRPSPVNGSAGRADAPARGVRAGASGQGVPTAGRSGRAP